MLGVGVGSDKNGRLLLGNALFEQLGTRFALRNWRIHASHNHSIDELMLNLNSVSSSSSRFAVIRCEDWEQNWE